MTATAEEAELKAFKASNTFANTVTAYCAELEPAASVVVAKEDSERPCTVSVAPLLGDT
eukprot:CAMPEP_0184977158 /NCGR_PEP_ID=MMETSP1098-20130426/7903_1 /TAXON_ID=89044 /ORGANISM="Spumella elongata, Strain CCAP 955/1" /LENGTH=58 /DNA_ID=CAMNT_0027500113 /DNA_START=47 /DNA_END=219 /DNA_ORIENTATION=-